MKHTAGKRSNIHIIGQKFTISATVMEKSPLSGFGERHNIAEPGGRGVRGFNPAYIYSVFLKLGNNIYTRFIIPYATER